MSNDFEDNFRDLYTTDDMSTKNKSRNKSKNKSKNNYKNGNRFVKLGTVLVAPSEIESVIISIEVIEEDTVNHITFRLQITFKSGREITAFVDVKGNEDVHQELDKLCNLLLKHGSNIDAIKPFRNLIRDDR